MQTIRLTSGTVLKLRGNSGFVLAGSLSSMPKVCVVSDMHPFETVQ